MANLKIGTRSFGNASDAPGQLAGPATRVVKLVKGAAIPDGACRGLFVGTAGTGNFTTLSGAVCANFPLQAGRNEVCISALAVGGTADDIWAYW